MHLSPPMALPPAAPDRIPFSDHRDWKICNDHGFIYRRRCHPLQTPCQPLSSALDLRRHRRTLKKRSLLSLRRKYSQELNHWKSLLHSPSAPSPPTATDSGAPPPLLPSAPSNQPIVDGLLLQAEAQEAVLRRLSELCDYVESLWNAAEEDRFAKELVDLPIWGSPKALVDALQSL